MFDTITSGIDPGWTRHFITSLGFGASVGTVLLLIALIPCSPLSRLRPSHRHQIILFSLLSLFILPGFAPISSADGLAPFSETNFAPYTFEAAGKFHDLGSPSKTGVPDPALQSGSTSLLWPTLFVLWSTGAAFLLLSLMSRIFSLTRWLRTSRQVSNPEWNRLLDQVAVDLGIRGNVLLRSHPKAAVPMIWGPPRPFIVLPEAMVHDGPGPDAGRMTFLHEMAHFERKDSLWKLVADVASVVFWFHPLVWIARNKMESMQEMAADSRVLESGVRPSDYSSYLLNLVRNSQYRQSTNLAGISSAAGRGSLSPRLTSILDRDLNHASPGRSTSILIGLVFCLTAGLIATVSRNVFAKEREEPSELAGPAVTLEAARLHEILNPLIVNKMTDSHIAGAAVCVVQNGKAVYSHGFGRAEVFSPRTVVVDKTIFRIGSVTKVVTGVALMQLVDQGKIDLEADVNRYLQAFKVDDNYPEPVRVKHLLTHTAGFDQLGYGRHVNSRDQVLPLGEFLKDNLVRIRPPGKISCYDTYGITLAGHLVSVISGQPYEQYLIENVFRPLGMDRTTITVPEAFMADVADGYEFAGAWRSQRWEYMNTDPASTVNSTVTDMGKFAIMMLNGGVYEGRRILSEKSAKAMMTRQFTNHPDQPGYGYLLFEDSNYGVPAFSHGGSMTGYGCFLYLVPSHGLGLFIAYNQESGALSDKIVNAVVEEAFPGRNSRSIRRPRHEGEIDISRFAGTYASNMYNHSRPERGGWSRRTKKLESGRNRTLIYEQKRCIPVDDLSFQREDGLLLTFLVDDDKKITHLVVRQTVYEKVD